MDFFQIINQNINTAIIFWSVFLTSILISAAYQKNLILKDRGKNTFSKMGVIIKSIWIALIVILPSLLIGFRGYNVGADTFNLLRGYLNLEYATTQIYEYDRILFSFFKLFAFTISNGNPTFYFFSMVFFTLFVLVMALEKWADRISLPLALFIYYSLFGMQLLNQSRQLMSLSIFIFAISYLIKKQYLKYTITILIASLFHFTALIGFIFMMLYFKKGYYYPIKKWAYYILLIISPVLIYPILFVINRILPSSYQGYIETASYEGIGLGLIITIFPVFIPLLLLWKYKQNHIEDYLIRIALLTYPLRFAGYYSYFLMRLNYFSSVFIVLLIPLLIRNVENKAIKITLILLVIITMFLYYIVHYMYVDAGGMFPYELRKKN